MVIDIWGIDILVIEILLIDILPQNKYTDFLLISPFYSSSKETKQYVSSLFFSASNSYVITQH